MLWVLWWSGFSAAAIWAQTLFPGVDFLAVGLVLSLQEEGRGQSLILALIFNLLQESMGSQPFGASMLWYWLLFLFISLGQYIFQSRSTSFVVILGLILGLLHLLQTYTMATLTIKAVSLDRVLLESLLQAILFPLEWLLVVKLYPIRIGDND